MTDGRATSSALPSTGPIRVLLIEDNPGDVRLVHEVLRDNGAAFEVDVEEQLEDGLHRFDPSRHHVILLDLGLPDSRGLATFERLHEVVGDATPIVIMSVTGDESLGVRAVAAGAQDYLVKEELPRAMLPRAIRYAVERQRLIKELEQLTNDMRTFVAQAAHDLRTPVTAVTGLAAILSEGTGDLADDELTTVVSSVHEQAVRLSNLVSDLAEFTRLHVDVVLEPVDVASAIGSALTQAAAAHDLEVSTRFEPVPPVRATRGRLERLMTNLLTNAAKYGGGTVQVSVAHVGDDVAIVVDDDGPGIPPDVREQLFEPFNRGSGAPDESTGLGLSIVRRLAESFGGGVELVEGELGGACFRVTVPVAA